MGETAGAIHWTVPTIIGDLEGNTPSSQGSIFLLNTTNNGVASPIPGGPVFWMAGSNITSGVYYQQPTTNGQSLMVAGQSGLVVNGFNIDLYGVILNTGPNGQ